ncbi:DUF4132 domain-containing protein [Glycomyces harbinensis]|uniref:DUF4132 domain-containing protein n=1 Tax=Glycomyces harbinensis TaxID=58114 RepID=A0A1G6WJN9_9ACTN|nr:DUF4132 domain-containing protein [Glycomyces harbinensis]SDD66092.1 protein of unknown function [Glycomyces harbinensis]
MTNPTDATDLPDEDLLDFPKSWERLVKPTRTTGKPHKVRLDAANGRRRLTAETAWLDQALDPSRHEQFLPSLRALLAGEPDPLGAAAAMAMLNGKIGYDADPARPLLHLWIAEHGLTFAARALAEYLTLYAGWVSQRPIELQRMELSWGTWHRSVSSGSMLGDMRALLAAAADDAYAAVVAALAGHRATAAQRFAVTLLVPDERDWADEVCAEHLQENADYWATAALVSEAVTTTGQLAALGLSVLSDDYHTSAIVAGLVRRLGTDAVPVLAASVGWAYQAGDVKTCHQALSVLPSDEAMAYFADHLGEPGIFAFAMEAAKRFPLRTLHTVAARLPGADAEGRKRLAALVHADPVLRAALAHLDADTRDRVAPLFEASARHPEADPADLPELLVAPPWTVKAPKVKAVVVEGLVPPAINRVVWADGEPEAWSEVGYDVAEKRTEERWRVIAERFADGELGPNQGLRFLVDAPRDIAAPLAGRWNAEGLDDWIAMSYLKKLLSRFGEAVSEQVAVGAATHASLREVLVPVANLEAARLMADGFARLKTVRETAVAWFDRHGPDAAALLIPDALGKAKRRRASAEEALYHLADEHGPDVVQGAAAQYGEDAAAAVRALIGTERSAPLRVKIPKPAAWAAPALLPQVLLKDGDRALPQDAVRHLVTVLALGGPDHPYAGVDVVAEACDRDSLNRFSLALFDLWTAAGSPGEDRWAVTQLVHFADDHTVRTLAPLVAKWPGENQHHRAVLGLKVLGAIGTEPAMRAVQNIAAKAKFDAIRWAAHGQVKAIAADLGLTADQLADRLVPDFGLGAEGSLRFDYGPRTFTVAFDEQLKPYVTDDAGKPRKTLPKPGAKDDPDLAEDAYRRFTALKKELRAVAADLVKRLESAMIHGRTWTAAEFRRLFAEHALAGHLARRLVWLAEHGGERTAYRIAEDGSLGDADDEAFALHDEAVVRLAHPIHLGPSVDAWAELFADYEILQPFDQLARPVMAFTDEELKTGVLTRFQGATVDIGHILGMTSRGWHRAAPEDAGMEPGIAYTFPGGGCVSVRLDPGVYTGSVREYDRQTLETVRLAAVEEYYHAPSGAVPESIDPVAASEALSGLARLTGTA